MEVYAFFICCNKVLSLDARLWSSVHFIRHLTPMDNMNGMRIALDNNIQLALCLICQYLCNTAHNNNILIPDNNIHSILCTLCKPFQQ